MATSSGAARLREKERTGRRRRRWMDGWIESSICNEASLRIVGTALPYLSGRPIRVRPPSTYLAAPTCCRILPKPGSWRYRYLALGAQPRKHATIH
jgi:hypothetical protein